MDANEAWEQFKKAVAAERQGPSVSEKLDVLSAQALQTSTQLEEMEKRLDEIAAPTGDDQSVGQLPIPGQEIAMGGMGGGMPGGGAPAAGATPDMMAQMMGGGAPSESGEDEQQPPRGAAQTGSQIAGASFQASASKKMLRSRTAIAKDSCEKGVVGMGSGTEVNSTFEKIKSLAGNNVELLEQIAALEKQVAPKGNDKSVAKSIRIKKGLQNYAPLTRLLQSPSITPHQRTKIKNKYDLRSENPKLRRVENAAYQSELADVQQTLNDFRHRDPEAMVYELKRVFNALGFKESAEKLDQGWKAYNTWLTEHKDEYDPTMQGYKENADHTVSPGYDTRDVLRIGPQDIASMYDMARGIVNPIVDRLYSNQNVPLSTQDILAMKSAIRRSGGNPAVMNALRGYFTPGRWGNKRTFDSILDTVNKYIAETSYAEYDPTAGIKIDPTLTGKDRKALERDNRYAKLKNIMDAADRESLFQPFKYDTPDGKFHAESYVPRAESRSPGVSDGAYAGIRNLISDAQKFLPIEFFKEHKIPVDKEGNVDVGKIYELATGSDNGTKTLGRTDITWPEFAKLALDNFGVNVNNYITRGGPEYSRLISKLKERIAEKKADAQRAGETFKNPLKGVSLNIGALDALYHDKKLDKSRSKWAQILRDIDAGMNSRIDLDKFIADHPDTYKDILKRVLIGSSWQDRSAEDQNRLLEIYTNTADSQNKTDQTLVNYNLNKALAQEVAAVENGIKELNGWLQGYTSKPGDQVALGIDSPLSAERLQKYYPQLALFNDIPKFYSKAHTKADAFMQKFARNALALDAADRYMNGETTALDDFTPDDFGFDLKAIKNGKARHNLPTQDAYGALPDPMKAIVDSVLENKHMSYEDLPTKAELFARSVNKLSNAKAPPTEDQHIEYDKSPVLGFYYSENDQPGTKSIFSREVDELNNRLSSPLVEDKTRSMSSDPATLYDTLSAFKNRISAKYGQNLRYFNPWELDEMGQDFAGIANFYNSHLPEMLTLTSSLERNGRLHQTQHGEQKVKNMKDLQDILQSGRVDLDGWRAFITMADSKIDEMMPEYLPGKGSVEEHIAQDLDDRRWVFRDALVKNFIANWDKGAINEQTAADEALKQVAKLAVKTKFDPVKFYKQFQYAQFAKQFNKYGEQTKQEHSEVNQNTQLANIASTIVDMALFKDLADKGDELSDEDRDDAMFSMSMGIVYPEDKDFEDIDDKMNYIQFMDKYAHAVRSFEKQRSRWNQNHKDDPIPDSEDSINAAVDWLKGHGAETVHARDGSSVKVGALVSMLDSGIDQFEERNGARTNTPAEKQAEEQTEEQSKDPSKRSGINETDLHRVGRSGDILYDYPRDDYYASKVDDLFKPTKGSKKLFHVISGDASESGEEPVEESVEPEVESKISSDEGIEPSTQSYIPGPGFGLLLDPNGKPTAYKRLDANPVPENKTTSNDTDKGLNATADHTHNEETKVPETSDSSEGSVNKSFKDLLNSRISKRGIGNGVLLK